MNRMIKTGMAAIALTSVFGLAHAQLELQNLWTITPADAAWFSDNHTTRGMTVNPATGNVLVVSRFDGLSVQVLNGMTGASVGTLDITGISGGTFALNMIGAAADGSIFATNLGATGSGADVKVYRWENEAAAPTTIFDGTLQGVRYGDNIAVRGSGSSVQVALLSGEPVSAAGSPSMAILSPDGIGGWDVTQVQTNAGRMQLGTAFGSGNSFFGTGGGHDLHEVDLVSGNLIETYGGAVFSQGVSVIAVDPANNYLAGLVTANGEIQLHDIATLDTFGTTLATATLFTPGNTANTNASGDMAFLNDILYVLNTNHGIAAYAIIPEPSTYALLFGLGVLGMAVWIRRRRS